VKMTIKKHRLLGLFTPLIALATHAQESNKWLFDFTLYGMAAGMSGQTTVKGLNANVDVGFDDVLEHLLFGAMGRKTNHCKPTSAR